MQRAVPPLPVRRALRRAPPVVHLRGDKRTNCGPCGSRSGYYVFPDLCPPVYADTMFAMLFDLEDYATTYRATRDAYLKAANELKLATGPYKAARDAYVAATATYTKSLYE